MKVEVEEHYRPASVFLDFSITSAPDDTSPPFSPENEQTTKQARKRKKSPNQWKTEIEMEKLNLVENPKDNRFYFIINKNNGLVAGVKCAFCDYYNQGSKASGTFYKHIRICAVKVGFEYDVQQEDKNNFARIQLEVMANNLNPSYGFCTSTNQELYQFLIDYGHAAALKAPKRPPPRIDQLQTDQEVLMNKLQSTIYNDFPKIKQEIQSLVKNHSGCIVIDVISKQKQIYGTVLHVFDDNWNLKILPLDFQHFEKDKTGKIILERIEAILNEYGLKIEDVSNKINEESDMLVDFKNVDTTSCAKDFLDSIVVEMLEPVDGSVFDGDVDETLKKIVFIIDKIKEITQIVCHQTNLYSQLHCNLVFNEETTWKSKLNLARQFLKLNFDDIKILQGADEPLPSMITTLVDFKQLIVDFVHVMAKFEEVLNQLKDDKLPTIHLVRPLFSKLESSFKEFASNQSEVIKALAISALATWNMKIPSFLTDIYDIACFLDPNQLPNFSKYFDDETLDKMVDKFKNAVSKFEEPKIIHGSNYDLVKRIKKADSDGQAVRYFQEGPNQSIKDFDLNNWWRKHEIAYPAVAKLAKKILPIPACSLSVPRLFSHLDDIMPKSKDVTISNLMKFRIITQFD